MKTSKKPFNKRAIVSIALFCIFVLLPVSGVMFAEAKHHPDTFASHLWEKLHELLGLLFMVCGVFHIVFNWKTLKRYLTGQK